MHIINLPVTEVLAAELLLHSVYSPAEGNDTDVYLLLIYVVSVLTTKQAE